MKLFFLYGLPGTGKLTIARELAELTGIKLFHNHLTVDLLLSVFEFGSVSFVKLRERIWLSVFEEAAALPAMIFTFNPENSVRQSFIQKTVETIESRDGEVFFVEVVCILRNWNGEWIRRSGGITRSLFRSNYFGSCKRRAFSLLQRCPNRT